MALIDLVTDTFPANDDTGVPLGATITITLTGTDYDTTSLEEGMVVEGADTDQMTGPGLMLLNRESELGTNIDTFLISPDTGLVTGTVTVSTSGGNTVVSFNPAASLPASRTFTVYLTNIKEADGLTLIDGSTYFSFTTGSGSIEEIPSTISTSVLASGGVLVNSTTPLTITRTTPTSNQAQVAPTLDEIVIYFNKAINPNSVSATNITIEGQAMSSHPKLNASYVETFAKIVSVSGNKITIRI